MAYQLSFDKFELFNGDDLEKAAAMSEIAVRQQGTADAPGLASVRRLIDDIANVRFRDLLPGRLVVSGTERDSGQNLSVLFSGPLRTLDFCATAIFGSTSYDEVSPASGRDGTPDIVVNVHRSYRLAPQSRGSIQAPQWVGQEFDLEESWPATIASLSSRLRKEIARMLRRHSYRVAMSTGPHAISQFKTELLNPSLQSRFGRGAIVARDDRFLRQCRDMLRLDLLHEDTVVAANLLEQRGGRLAIRKSALKPGMDDLRGRADVLDYFSLLTAQLLGCGILDFGLSRPHLEDGSFRYKAKWGTRIVACDGMKAAIRIIPQLDTAAVRAFLRRSFFLQRARSGFAVRVMYDADSPPLPDWRLWRLADIEGIDHVELLYRGDSKPSGIPADWLHRVRTSEFCLPDNTCQTGGAGP